MSTAFYTRMAETAAGLLAKYGATIILTRPDPTIQRTSADAVTAGTPTTYSPKGLFLDYSDEQIDGTTIKIGDRMVLLDNTQEPQYGDLITHETEQWSIVNIEKIKPTSVAIIYRCQIRG